MGMIEELKEALPEAKIELKDGCASIDTGRFLAVVSEGDGGYGIEWTDCQADNPTWCDDWAETVAEIATLLSE